MSLVRLKPALADPFAIPEAPSENRVSRRQRVLLAGRISFGLSVANCTIRDLTTTGARIHAPGILGLPDEVHLLILREGLVVRTQRVWVRAQYAGLKFLASEEVQTATSAQGAALRRAWDEWMSSQGVRS